ncbi:MAG: DUF58 domain-containing protein [Caldilineales bacterium]|nr:DUF58 domain-containing protein [Caldilineales bacterium]MDW8317027.1 DUF58 domain-containing protein [Anaerolineae bacterium]
MRRSWWILLLWLASVVFAVFVAERNRTLAFSIVYLLTAIIVFTFLWSWANVNWVRINRYTRARRAQVGRLAEEQFEVVNLSRLPKLWLEVLDHSELPNHHASRVLNTLGPRGSRRWVVRTLCLQRGRFRLGPLTLISSDPLGLFPRQRRLPATSTIVVYPATVELPGFTPPSGLLPGGDAMRRRTHYVTTNVSGVRDYVPGDSFNRIHWPSTARTGRLIVKEFELDPIADVWILLDLDRSVHVSQPWTPPDLDRTPAALWQERPALQLPPSTLEYAVTVAASLARHFLLENRSVGLIGHSVHRELIQADRGERQLTRVLETLAVIAAGGRVPFAQVLATEGEHLARHTTLLAITPSCDLGWVAALRDVGRRGVRSVAIQIAANTFGSAPSHEQVVAELLASGIATYVISYGQDIAAALSQRVTSVGAPASNGSASSAFRR